jgi:stage 0 sporulation protein B (sporulation initiation phosphotransferase)
MLSKAGFSHLRKTPEVNGRRENGMAHGSGLRAAAGAVSVLALAALVIWPMPLVIRAVLAVVAGGSAWLLGAAVLDGHKLRERETILRLLTHYRHDWMNELQVLFGYTRLKKYDILPEYMDKIRTSALQDSLICKLGNPALAVYLMEQRVSGGTCRVEIELETEMNLQKLVMSEKDVFRLIEGVSERLIRNAVPSQGEPSVLSLGFDEEEAEILVDFVFQGEADWARLRTAVSDFLHKYKDKLSIREEEYGEDRAVIALALPFPT